MNVHTSAAPPIPIFIISFNRHRWLRRAVSSYHAQNADIDIIIHDNGSDDPNTLEELKFYERKRAKVYYRKKIHHANELINVNSSIERYFKEYGPQRDYIVTDCDIDLSIASPNAILLYKYLLDIFKDIQCCGPMLKISDIRKSYPLFNQVINRHVDQFWKKTPTWIDTPFGKCAAIVAPFDTTFAVHRKGSVFRRGKIGLRVYAPFEAKHLDWYLGDGEMAEFKTISSDEVSHWANNFYIDSHRNVGLLFNTYTVVEYNQSNELVCSTKSVPQDHPD